MKKLKYLIVMVALVFFFFFNVLAEEKTLTTDAKGNQVAYKHTCKNSVPIADFQNEIKRCSFNCKRCNSHKRQHIVGPGFWNPYPRGICESREAERKKKQECDWGVWNYFVSVHIINLLWCLNFITEGFLFSIK